MEDNTTSGSRLHNIYAFLKYVMVFVNSALIICGAILIGLGLWIKYGSDSFVKALGSHSAYFMHVSLFCIAAGIIMVILGFLGCYGALKEKRYLLLIFFLIMLALFICEIVAAVVVLAFADVADSIIKDKGLQSIKKTYYENDGKGLVAESWDAIMKKFNCCGFFGYEDFVNSTFSVKTGLKYPKTCCKSPTLTDCNGQTISDQVIYTQGCFPAILEEVKKNSMALGITAAVITGWEAVQAISCSLSPTPGSGEEWDLEHQRKQKRLGSVSCLPSLLHWCYLSSWADACCPLRDLPCSPYHSLDSE